MEDYAENPPAEAEPKAPAIPSYLLGARCAAHSEVQATGKCDLCDSHLCETCNFALSDKAICPKCVLNPNKTISTRRKSLGILALLFAILATASIFIVSSMIITDPEQEENIVALGFLLSMLFATIGAAISLTIRDRRLHSPVSSLIALIWNGGFLVLFVLLMFISFFFQ